MADASFEAVLGFSIPQGDRDPSLPIDPSGSLELAAGTPRGDKVIGIITAAVEKIGGGGHLDSAGAKSSDSMLEALEKLKGAIDEYIEENDRTKK